jgi:CubicO group peptidase (beta-lactamase class C family)
LEHISYIKHYIMPHLFRTCAFALALCCNAIVAQSQNLYFPPLTGTTWQSITPASLGWCQTPLDTLQAYVQRTHAKSFIVLKDGKIVVEWYFDGFTQDSVHYWASAGKTMTGLLVGVAQTEGILSINDTTSRFLGTGWSSLTPQQERLVKIKNQLTMTTGLDDNVPDDNCTTPACLVYKADAGTRWAYHNAPYHLLQDIVAAASGITYQQYTATRLKQKTGMDGFWYDYIYYSKPRSMARFGLLLLNKGKWNTTTVLSDTAYFGAMTRPSNPYNQSYGYLTWLNGKGSCMVPSVQTVFAQDLIPSAPADMYCALGKNDQKIYVVPSQNMVIIRTGDAATNATLALSAYDEVLWQKINALLCVSTKSTSENTASVRVFPNPSSDCITLETSETIKSICIYNTIGQPVLVESGISAPTISVAHLPKGIYFIQIKTDKGSVNTRFEKF